MEPSNQPPKNADLALLGIELIDTIEDFGDATRNYYPKQARDARNKLFNMLIAIRKSEEAWKEIATAALRQMPSYARHMIATQRGVKMYAGEDGIVFELNTEEDPTK